MSRFVPFLLSLALAFAAARGDEPPKADALAVLEEHCVQCHNPQKTKGASI